MKVLKNLLYILFFSCIALGVNACGEGDGPDNPDNPEQEIVEGKWTEKGNQLIFKQSYDYGYGIKYEAVWTLTFENDKCVKSVCACKFGDSLMAETFYQSLKETEDVPVTKSGNTVTIDYTEMHKGLGKDELKAAISASGGWE